MRCADLVELLSAYADGQAVRAQADFMKLHLCACPRCRQSLQTQLETRQLLETLHEDDWQPPDLTLRAIRAYQQQQRAAARRLLPIWAALCIVAATLVATLGGAHSIGQQAAPAGHATAAATKLPGTPIWRTTTSLAPGARPAPQARPWIVQAPVTLGRHNAVSTGATPPSPARAVSTTMKGGLHRGQGANARRPNSFFT